MTIESGRPDRYRHYLGDSEGWGGTNRGDQEYLSTRLEIDRGKGHVKVGACWLYIDAYQMLCVLPLLKVLGRRKVFLSTLGGRVLTSLGRVDRDSFASTDFYFRKLKLGVKTFFSGVHE